MDSRPPLRPAEGARASSFHSVEMVSECEQMFGKGAVWRKQPCRSERDLRESGTTASMDGEKTREELINLF